MLLMDGLEFSETSYLIKTSNSESQKKIASSVFCDGDLIYTRSEKYNGHLNEAELFKKVRNYHDCSKSNLKALFKLSEMYANSRDLRLGCSRNTHARSYEASSF